MSFLLITGTIAVFSYEIDWLLNPEMRADEWIEHDQVSWGAAYDSARREFPRANISGISRQQDPWFALQASGQTRWNESIRIWLEPVNGFYIGTTNWYNLQRFFRQIHRHLMLPNNIGIPIVTVMGFSLLISLIAGFVVYKKFWRGFFRWPRFKRETRIWVGDLHRLAGLWTSWFVALIALTSVFYFIEELGGRAPPFPSPTLEVIERESVLPPSFNGDSLDQAIFNAREAMPGLEIRNILFPGSTRGTILIRGDHTAALVRPRANTVYIDPTSLDAIGKYQGEDLDPYTRVSEASDPLHFGYFGGFITKIIWFILGVIMSGLAITGVVIYTKRLRKVIGEESLDSKKINTEIERNNAI